MNPQIRQFALIFFGALAFVGFWQGSYQVTEGQQVLITQFGRIVGEPVTKAGLHFKMPFIQRARYFDKRILSWDGDPNQIPTKDKKYIEVDTTARWRIADPVKFAQTVHDERGALARLDGILDGITRDQISNNNLIEAVRNTNTILERMQAKQKAASERDAATEEAAGEDGPSAEAVLAASQVEEEITGEIEPVSVGREKLSEVIASRARTELEALGIDLIDVQLRSIAYESSVEKKVYNRMISERQRIAEKIRSIGKGEEAKIRGKLNLDLKEIESIAYRKSEEIKGRADGEATGIYANSMRQDPEYYSFLRTLEAYKKTVPASGEIFLTTDNEFLRLLKTSK
jgi:membrane protease subunit HflC